MVEPAPDVSVVLTGHREGTLALATFRALERAIEAAIDDGLGVEVVGVLDRADEATTAVFRDALDRGGPLGRLAATLVVATDLGDPGAARNAGVRRSRAPWVCVLDADNLPTRTWLAAAHRRAIAHGGRCVVHPEHLVIFGQRWQAWPQLPSAHPGFRAQNFYDRTFWDTFCLASRDVFDLVPYAVTSARSGLGPEDWHWGMETVHAGVEHVVAAETALLYRVKASASVQEGHETARSLLPPSRLLVDTGLTVHDESPAPHRPDRFRGLHRSIVGDDHARDPVRGRLTDDERASLSPEVFDVHHYRALNADALHLEDTRAVRHYLDVGRPDGRRSLLTDIELLDLRRLDVDDYRALHPDLAGLGDADLLHHYLAHGRAEGRAPAMTPEQRAAGRTVTLSDAVVAELRVLHEVDAEVPAPTEDALRGLHHVGPPDDGSITAGSRAWWDLVSRLGRARPDTIVFVGSSHTSAPARPPDATAGVLVVDTADEGGSGEAHRARPDDRVLRLRDLTGWRLLTPAERRRLMAMLVVQYAPARVRVAGSAEFEAAAREFATPLASSTDLG